MSFPARVALAELPEPVAEALAHSDRLQARIAERIADNGGFLGFDDYMGMALYEPGLGYYSAGTTKFGADGDFVTAPELSDLFGQCLAQQFEQLLQQGVAPGLLEFSAGSGKLCAQILEALPDVRRYHILEASADLRQRQQVYLHERLGADLFHKIEWLSQLPRAFDGIVLANEVLDAMPVKLLLKQDGWFELGVGLDAGALDWQAVSAGAETLAALEGIEALSGELPRGYCTEVNLNYRPWLNALAAATGSVVVMLIDYGYERGHYYHPERSSGTMTCHYRHHVHADPLCYPGLQDITAFVDFDACADAAEAAGLQPLGLVDQGAFLLANGLLERAQRASAKADAMGQLAISQQVARLSLPQEMGEKFKVLALSRNIEVDMPAMRRGRFHG